MTAPESGERPEIVTEGTGWSQRLGDRAELDVGFAATALTRADAVRDLGRRVAAAEPALSRSGLTVAHRRLWVRHEYRGDRVVGCRAGEDLELLLVDVAVLEPVLSDLIGTEPVHLGGPRWVLDDPAAVRLEAQQRAVDDARRRAEGYAGALGGRLGPLRRLSEAASDRGSPAFRMAAAESGPAGPDVRELGLEPEPVRVTVRCTTTWSLLA